MLNLPRQLHVVLRQDQNLFIKGLTKRHAVSVSGSDWQVQVNVTRTELHYLWSPLVGPYCIGDKLLSEKSEGR